MEFLVEQYGEMSAEDFAGVIKLKNDQDLSIFYYALLNEYSGFMGIFEVVSDFLPDSEEAYDKKLQKKAREYFKKPVDYDFLKGTYDNVSMSLLLLSEKIEIVGKEGLERDVFTRKGLGWDTEEFNNISRKESEEIQ